MMEGEQMTSSRGLRIETLDLGTPAPAPVPDATLVDSPTVTLMINSRVVEVPPGTSVMRAAISAGIGIPKLCATDSLEPFGSCRLCLVEIEGQKGFPASCTTPVREGMVVHTESDQLHKLRQGVMELYLSDHPLDCLTCAANGDCELQTVAGQVGVREVRYGVGQAAGAHHTDSPADVSNPYFKFDPSKCIVCNRCVRACEEVQGTFALTVEDRGFESRIRPGPFEDFLQSECVSCGACVQACPTASLQEKSVIEFGTPSRSVLTTCAYCGVGCGLKAELNGDRVVRMVPWKEGKANEGHACVKGRFAWGYATHRDRIKAPMIRDHIHAPWQVVSWEEAFAFVAKRFKEIQATYGRDAVGGITSSRCTNEETYLVQKLIRAALGTNNVDTCARVCHSPTGYGLSQTLGTSAGTQSFRSVEKADVVVLIGTNPTDAHPVFASRLKRRLREGAKLIVIDPRRIDLVQGAHAKAAHHLALKPGTNVAIINAMAHVIVSEGLEATDFVKARCEADSWAQWREFILQPENSPEAVEVISGVPAAEIRDAARLYAQGPNSAIYYGLGVTEHAQGSTMVIGIANLAMACGMLGRDGVGVNPMRGQNNVQGSCDMGSFPHEFPGYRHVGREDVRQLFESDWGVPLSAEPGLRIPNMFDLALSGQFKALYCQGEDIVQSDPDTTHVTAALEAMDCVVVQDIFMNETARYAHVILPGSSFLEKDGTFTNAERRISRVRKVMAPLAGLADWEVTQGLANALGYPMSYEHPSQIMNEIARLTPSFAGVSFKKIDELGSMQWPCNPNTPLAGQETMHVEQFARSTGLGRFVNTKFWPTQERATRQFPLILTTGRILSQYNVGAQTRRTANNVWHDTDLLEIHPSDAKERGIADGDWVHVTSRAGQTRLKALCSERMQPGVVYTTFHFPVSGANVVTTENSDWATNCPEYKVTAVQVIRDETPTAWQTEFESQLHEQETLMPTSK